MAGFGLLWRVLKHEKASVEIFLLAALYVHLWGCGQRQGGKTPESQTKGSERQGVLSYETGDAGVTITDCEESAEGEVVIPDEIAGLPFIRIGTGAFYQCISLTSISIPQAFHSEDKAWRLGISRLWPDGFALTDSSSK